MCNYFRMIKNHLLLYLGYTLVNRDGFTVKLYKGKQVMSNPRRKTAYRLDHFSWKIVKERK